MNFFKFFRKLWEQWRSPLTSGKEGGFCPTEESREQRQGRVYEVPAERVGRGPVAGYELWTWLHKRCPEVKHGHWKLVVSRVSAEVVEVLS